MQQNPVTQSSWAFERASVLLNLAVCSCAHGVGASRADIAGIQGCEPLKLFRADFRAPPRRYASEVISTLPYDLYNSRS